MKEQEKTAARPVDTRPVRRKGRRLRWTARARARALAWLLLVAALAVAPFVAGSYRTLLLTEILIFGLFASSFNLLFGYTGLLSFGHAAYFAGGAYASALVMVEAGLPLPAGILAGLVGGALLAALFGVFCVRVNEIYFSLLTLAFGMLVYTLLFQAREITGGSDGFNLYELGSVSVAGRELLLGHPQVFYFVTLVTVVVGVALLHRIAWSPFGQVLRAIRENSERVDFLGIPVRRYRYKAFVIAGAMAGLAGGLIAPFLRVAHPQMSHWTTSAEVVLGTILGGEAFFLGPAVGIGVLIWLESIVTGRTVYWPLVMGVILLVLVLFLPGGVVGMLARIYRRARGSGR